MRTSLVLCSLLAISACGDNANDCDPDTTTNVDGKCVGTTACTDGTILVDGKCEIDPNSCRDGTVLVGGACVDPAHVIADVNEAMEPNGLGLFEDSDDPAGELTLKPVGSKLTVHGKIIPFRDDDGDTQIDPDIDTYVFQVTAPTMLEITADGLHGLVGGFVSVANVAGTDPFSDWIRLGINLTGDTSKRQIFLPVAGIYLLGVGDSRTLLLSSSSAGAQMGKPDFEYYVTVEQVAFTPTVLTPTNGIATSTGMRQPGEVKVFSIAMGEGVNTAELVTAADQVDGSVVITNTRSAATSFKAVANEDDTDVAETSVLGIRTGDMSTVVADATLDYANSATPYTLNVSVGNAGALSTTGTGVMLPKTAGDFSTFYYDVAPDGLLVGMNLSFNVPVVGAIVTENFTVFSNFTFDPIDGFAFNETFQAYKGLLKHATPGRYYFVTFDPTFTSTSPPAMITATSTYNALIATPIIKGTALTGQAMNVFESNPYTYAPGIAADPWQTFTIPGTATGTITAAFFQANAVGRMDTLVNQCGSFCEDRPVPVFTHTHTAGVPTRGRILLDNATLMSSFMTINTATVTGTPTWDLDFKAQTNVNDLGTVVAGMSGTANDRALDATATVQRYLIRATAGNRVNVTVSPDAGTMDTRIQRVNPDETANGTAVNNAAAGLDDTVGVFQSTNGWTAFTVNDIAAPTTGGTVDVDVAIGAPITYNSAASATVYDDACINGGAVVAMSDPDDGRSNATINAPAGFDFFGFPATSIRAFTNGFLSVDGALACASFCFFSNADMPGAANPNGIMAPYWDDLELSNGSVCSKVSGTKLIVQWTGEVLDASFNPIPNVEIEMQVIIDGANDTVEFVYGPNHNPSGTSATIGLENQLGNAAKKQSFNTGVTPATTLFTPM